jgi:NitT/TauT family transport system ATP-binding protein
MIEVDNLSHRFADLPAVGTISFTVEDGEFLSIVGPSGCGKTTLLRIIAGLLAPTAGSVRIGGEPPEALVARGGMGFVSQKPALLPWRTSLGNVALPLEILDGRMQSQQDPVKLLEGLGLGPFLKSFPRELSGGMEQRVALARALVFDPSILLMDEPFSALDEISRERLDADLLQLSETRGRTIVFITHSVTEAVLLSDRIVVLTERPARIREIVDVDLPRPRQVGRRSDQHLHLIERVRQLLLS